MDITSLHARTARLRYAARAEFLQARAALLAAGLPDDVAAAHAEARARAYLRGAAEAAHAALQDAARGNAACADAMRQAFNIESLGEGDVVSALRADCGFAPVARDVADAIPCPGGKVGWALDRLRRRKSA